MVDECGNQDGGRGREARRVCVEKQILGDSREQGGEQEGKGCHEAHEEERLDSRALGLRAAQDQQADGARVPCGEGKLGATATRREGAKHFSRAHRRAYLGEDVATLGEVRQEEGVIENDVCGAADSAGRRAQGALSHKIQGGLLLALLQGLEVEHGFGHEQTRGHAEGPRCDQGDGAGTKARAERRLRQRQDARSERVPCDEGHG